jgi:hypothetical protein
LRPVIQAQRKIPSLISTNEGQYLDFPFCAYPIHPDKTSMTSGNLGDLLQVDAASFTSDGRLLMQYLNGDIAGIA